MKWGHRKAKPHTTSTSKKTKKTEPTTEHKKKSSTKSKAKDAEQLSKFADSERGKELRKRGKAAVGVLLSGDNTVYIDSDRPDYKRADAYYRCRGAIERMIYTDEEINRQRWWGVYNW